MSINQRVLIIDSLNTFLRVWASIPVISNTGEHIGGVQGFLRSIGSNIRDFAPSKCILVFDGKGGSYRRKKLYPEYKGNRINKGTMRRDFFSTKEEEMLSLRSQLAKTILYLDTLPVQVISVDNIEADDTIAYIAKQLCADSEKVRIVSTDRDFLQLVNDKIEVYSPVKKKLYTPTGIQQEYGILNENYLVYRILSGDDGDNIDGVGGIGLKTFIKEFPTITTDKIDIDTLIQLSENNIKTSKKPKKIFQNIVNSKDIIWRNHELMQLSEVNISGISKMQILDKFNAKVKFPNYYQFQLLAQRDALIFKDVTTWLYSTFNGLAAWSKQT